jgi:Holliday junction DNA helicase RuvB
MRPPAKFQGFIGQAKIVRHLRRQLAGAQVLIQPMPHLLLCGASGSGKTTLAEALAAEYGSKCVRVLGKAQPKHVVQQLPTLAKGDFLFLDEAHRLPRDSQELLYQVVDECRCPDLLEPGHTISKDTDGRLILPPITIILATDQPGELLHALKQRVEITATITDYSLPELREIAASIATDLRVLLTAQAVGTIARVAQGTPRRVRHLVTQLRRHYAGMREALGVDEIRQYLHQAGVCRRTGIDRQQRQYLRQLGKRGRAAIETLARLMGVDADYIRDQIEPGLLRLDLLEIGRTGRALTQAGQLWYDASQRRKESSPR